MATAAIDRGRDDSCVIIGERPIARTTDLRRPGARCLFLAVMLLSVLLPMGARLAAADEPASWNYTVEVAGDMEPDVKALLLAVSQLVALADRPPVGRAGLGRRVADDRERMLAALASEGFHAASIESAIDDEVRPRAVLLTVDTGPVFLIGDYAVRYTRPTGAVQVPVDESELGLALGARARAAAFKEAEERILVLLRRRGFPFPAIQSTRYVADHDVAAVGATVTVDPGAAAVFGPLAISGLVTVREDYIRRVLDWPEGQPFDSAVLTDRRQRLSRAELFESIVLETDQTVPPDGRLPVRLKVKEQKHRSVSVGLSVTSSEELVKAKGRWELRNVAGAGERIRNDATLSLLEQEAAIRLRKPYYVHDGQDLIGQIVTRHETSDAFEESSLATLLALERKTGTLWTTSVGAAAEVSALQDSFSDGVFALVGVPVSVARDSRDSLLDPTTGSRVAVSVTPWASLTGSSSGFLIGDIAASTYFAPFGDNLILAVRGRLGAIIAGGLTEIPANKRFYTGGGGSVRGFELRRIGPLDSAGDPIGGQSLAEGGMELRIKLTDTIGIVPFVDAGQVFDASLPDFSREIRWAGGLGIRYYTPIGPLRFDFAMPVNGRNGIDDAYQFYLSIGQAF